MMDVVLNLKVFSVEILQQAKGFKSRRRPSQISIAKLKKKLIAPKYCTLNFWRFFDVKSLHQLHQNILRNLICYIKNSIVHQVFTLSIQHRLKNSILTFRIPHKKRPWWVTRVKVFIRLKSSIPEGDLEMFQSFGP